MYKMSVTVRIGEEAFALRLSLYCPFLLGHPSYLNEVKLRAISGFGQNEAGLMSAVV